MRRRYTVLGILALICVIVLLIGCAKTDEGNNTTAPAPAATTNTQTQTPAAETAAPAEELWNTKFDPPVEFSTTLITFSDYVYPEGMTATDNMWTRYMLDKYGVKLTYKFIAASQDEWTSKNNLAMASGDFAELFRGNQATLEQLYAADKLADLTEVFDKYASPLLKEYFDSDAGRQARASISRDGKMLGFPFFRDPTDDFGYIYIRTDWLAKVGMQPPKTIKDVMAIAEAFATQDPDGNGVNDTYGFGLNKGLMDTNGAYYSMDQFFYGFQAFPHSWLDDGTGKLVYGSIQPEIKTALQAMQDMYKAGWIDKEFGTKDIGMAIEDTAAGKIGLFYGQGGIPGGALQPHHNVDPDAQWGVFPIVSADDRPVLNYISPTNIIGWYFVNKESKHPEIPILFANAYADNVFGPDADMETYYTGANGAQHYVYAPVQLEPPAKHLTIYKGVQDVLSGALTPDDLPTWVRQPYDKVAEYLEGGDQAQWWYNMKYGENGQYAVVDYYLQNNMYMQDAYIGPPTKTQLDKWATLRTLQMSVYSKIIMGESIDLFDKYVEDFKSLGGDDITREVNEWYAKNK